MLISGEHVEVGTEILVRLLDGLDSELFGSGWRIGTVTKIGTDIVADEPVFLLDDDAVPIYAAHVDFVTVLDRTRPRHDDLSAAFDG